MVPSFPHLTEEEFHTACTHLLHVFQACQRCQTGWTSVELIRGYETSYLRITKLFQSNVNVNTPLCQDGLSEDDNSDDLQELADENDQEALPTLPYSPAFIMYDIILSPTYRVPVLYVHISDPQHRFPPTISTLYEYIVPTHFKAETEVAGVIGGITVTDHPIIARPVFFIHPCQTPQVMVDSVGKNEVSPYEFLLLWLGSLGKFVGLHVPLALVAKHV